MKGGLREKARRERIWKLEKREIEYRDEKYARSVVKGAQGLILSPRLACELIFPP